MKKIFVLILLLLSIFFSRSYAQSEATSPRMSFNITKEVKPPLWEMVEEPYFVDSDGNKAIDALEKCKIVMKIKNIGMGDGLGLTAKITAKGTTEGISYSNQSLPTIKVGNTATVEYPINTSIYTEDGLVEFTVYVDEPLGFNTEPLTLKVQTRKFQEPLLIVKDYVVSGDKGGVLEKQKPFTLQVLVQNVQQGTAENVRVELKYPKNVFNVSGQDLYTFSEWSAGETQTLTYQLLVNGLYDDSELPLTVKISEKYGKYAQNKEINLSLNQPLASRTIKVESQISQTNIEDVQLRSDVDRDIPKTSKKNEHCYAIIIGNEDYHTYQNGLEKEHDVPFALADAQMFKNYCVNTLGVLDENIEFLNNAIGSKMRQKIEKITLLATMDPEAEIFFFYAGHGCPDENSKEPYLLPVDMNAVNLNEAISLYWLFDKLSSAGAKRVTVFLDACFTGGRRDADKEAGLLASRGVRVTPKMNVLNGNTVVFSATSAQQTALPYMEKQHGMFTYFLLKKIQESKGECTYEELYDYLNTNVRINSVRIYDKLQTPEVNTSPQVQTTWGDWSF